MSRKLPNAERTKEPPPRHNRLSVAIVLGVLGANDSSVPDPTLPLGNYPPYNLSTAVVCMRTIVLDDKTFQANAHTLSTIMGDGGTQFEEQVIGAWAPY